MALLAEQKRKTKFGLDPRNTVWSNDDSKFGQRLMEKMGWEKGKGLGAHEDGITEHIKASYKSDSRGLGCTNKDADAWIAHQDDFNDLLKALNSQSEAGNQEKKAEQTKQTHVDGHKRYYGRFSRGQVQTLRSTDDLDCIFGKRKRKSKTSEPDKQPETKPDCSDDDQEEKRHGLTTTTSTSSVQEYFAKKMAEMKARKEASTRESSSVDVDSSQTTQTGTDSVDCEGKKEKKSAYNSFSFSYNDHEMKEVSSSADADEAAYEQKCRGWYQDFSENTSSDIQNIEIKKSSKKKKHKKMKSDTEDNDRDVEIMSNSKKCKTNKERKENMLDDSVTINSHASLELSELPSAGEIEEKKRSKKKKIKENVTLVPCEEKQSKKIKITEDVTVAPCEEKRSKKKKIKENVTLVPCEEKLSKKNKITEDVTAAPCEENKRSKKNKIKENETAIVTESTCSNTSNIDDGSEDNNKQKKKKIKTCNKGEIEDNDHNGCASDVIDIKNKTTDASNLKRQSEGSVMHNSKTNGDAAHELDRENIDCGGRKKKSKKRKHCENYSDEECPVESQHDNDDSAVKKKKKKRRKDSLTGEADNKETRDDDSQSNEESAAAKHKSNTLEAENENVANVTESSEQPENKRNEKKRQKKKKKKTKLVKDQCAKSKAFFPGSNIAEIVGYGHR